MRFLTFCALICALLWQAACLAIGQCHAVHSPSVRRQAYLIVGAVFEPISPCEPWGPKNQFHADIRSNSVLVFQDLRDRQNFEKSPNAFRARILPYHDAPGNGFMAQMQLGVYFQMYLLGLQHIWGHYEEVLGPNAGSERLGAYSMVQTSFNSRTAYISVWSEPNQNGQLLGFTRIFDGTDYSNLGDKPYAWKAYYAPILPVEYSLSVRGIKVSYFENLRKQNYHIFEIGKYFLSKDLEKADRDYVRRILHKFWQENFMDENYLLYPDKAIFIFHTASDKLRDFYGEVFGTQEIPKDSVIQGQLKPNEHILFVDLKTIRQKLGFQFESGK